jgi:membrane protease YdiL (CAAX protease family)
VEPSQSPYISEPIIEPQGNFSQGTLASPPPALIDANNPPWGTLAALGFWIVSIILLGIVPILTSVPYLVYRASKGATLAGETLVTDKNFLFFSVLGVIPAHLLTLGLAWLVVTRAGKYPFWKTLGWEAGNFKLWKSIVIAVALLGLGLLITYFIGGKKTQLEELINSSYRTRVTTAFLAATTAPLVEEIIYRGILYSALQRVMGMVASVLIVSLLFAGIHVYQYSSNIGVILVITLLSFTLTIVRAYSGRLLPSYLIHLVFNGIQSVLLVVSPFFEKTQPVVPQPVPGLITTLLRFFC